MTPSILASRDMADAKPHLFEPFRLAGMVLRNRIVRSATAERFAGPDGLPDVRQEQMYEDLAAGEVGLIITGHAFVEPAGRCHAEMMGVHDDSLIEPLSALARAAHRGGAKIAVQINHGGRSCDEAVVARTVAPSAIARSPGKPLPRELGADDIDRIVSAFGRAARRVREAGFDAVQIHGAHGYLVSQFLSPLSNRRTDAYGGSLSNRARFLRRVAAAVRQAVGPGFPVLVKLGVTDNRAHGLSIAEGAEVASWLHDFGIDAVEVSTGLRGAIVSDVAGPADEAYLLPLGEAVRPRTELPLILVGGMRSVAVMERVLHSGVDLIAMSRPLICEPDLPAKLRRGETDRAHCRSCSRCWPASPGDGISCKCNADSSGGRP